MTREQFEEYSNQIDSCKDMIREIDWYEELLNLINGNEAGSAVLTAYKVVISNGFKAKEIPLHPGNKIHEAVVDTLAEELEKAKREFDEVELGEQKCANFVRPIWKRRNRRKNPKKSTE